MIQPVASTAFEADDAESLRAALSVFEDWDSDLTALFTLGKEATTTYKRETKQTKTVEPSAPYKQRRDARKQEIAALRAQVDELETVVALEKSLIKQPPPLTDEPVEAVALRNEWERIASNQHHQRLAAEVENAKLRELVASQVKNAEQILKLTKRVNQLERALPPSAVVSFENFKGPNVDVQTQLRRLDTMLPRATELFATGAFATLQRDCFHEVHFCENARDLCGVGIQFEASWLLPFETERVADALWVHTVRPTFKNKKSVFMDIHEDTNCLASQFISTPGLKEGWGASQGQFTARRLPPDLGDGSVLILITIQARAYLDSSWQGSADVEGWLRIESVPFHNVQPMTRVKWYRHTLLQPPEVETIAKNELSKWVSAVISGPTRAKFEKDIEWSVQALENMLLSPQSII